MPLINPSRVTEIFMDCHWKSDQTAGKSEEQLIAESAVAKTVACYVGFNPATLRQHQKEIAEMLLNLEPDFMESSGANGMTFLRAPLDKNADQWGEQQSADRLIALGMALGWVDFPFPRPAWIALPGSVPYVVVRDKKINEDLEKQDEVR